MLFFFMYNSNVNNCIYIKKIKIKIIIHIINTLYVIINIIKTSAMKNIISSLIIENYIRFTSIIYYFSCLYIQNSYSWF